MSGRDLAIDDRLRDYIASVTPAEAPALRRLRAETKPLRGAGMQIGAAQGQLMQLLVRLIGAKRCLEVGTFTGYSALAVALALPADGRIVCCDINAEWTAIGRRHWEEAGMAGKIDLRLAPAVETLDALIAAGEAGRFDFAFIDADKSNYDTYYERALVLLRPRGLIAIDNVLWSGAVADPAANDADTAALKRLNAKIAADARVQMTLLPIGDGVTLAVKL
ncbi:MAG: class I SAM-dependent methyltransferase [Alphaproteobacteria bacterium]|nr:class I SAM-dependent methyltransferase [Alphaproteobacteria bacterium]